MNILEAFNESPYKSIKHTTYFNVYEKIFSRFVAKEIVFVEVGVLHGGSLFMWRNFFGANARIIGIDFNPGAKRWEEEGFEIYIGSQSDPKFWDNFFAEVGAIDVLLDDGGHTYEQQIITTDKVIPNIKDGGILAVEDTHTSYMKRFNGPTPLSFVSYAKNIIDGINFRFQEFAKTKTYEKDIFSVQFFESFVVFEVNRSLCATESSRIDNGGKSVGAVDFRHGDPEEKRASTVAEKLKKSKLISKLKLKELKRYFKY